MEGIDSRKGKEVRELGPAKLDKKIRPYNGVAKVVISVF